MLIDILNRRLKWVSRGGWIAGLPHRFPRVAEGPNRGPGGRQP